MQHTEYHGTYINRDFSRENLRSATLGGRFVGCDFSRNDLTNATLCGEFVSCTFNATVRRARMETHLVQCEEV